jgi:hypothetical protein
MILNIFMPSHCRLFDLYISRVGLQDDKVEFGQVVIREGDPTTCS